MKELENITDRELATILYHIAEDTKTAQSYTRAFVREALRLASTRMLNMVDTLKNLRRIGYNKRNRHDGTIDVDFKYSLEVKGIPVTSDINMGQVNFEASEHDPMVSLTADGNRTGLTGKIEQDWRNPDLLQYKHHLEGRN